LKVSYKITLSFTFRWSFGSILLTYAQVLRNPLGIAVFRITN